MTEDDLAAVLEIERESYPMPWSKEHFLEELRKPYARAWVLTDDETDEEVWGYVVFWWLAGEAELLNLSVRPDLRRKGVGRALLAELIRQSVREGLQNLSLDVRRSNLAAIQLYQKARFQIVNVRREFYADREDAYHMSLKLTGAPEPWDLDEVPESAMGQGEH